MNENVELTFNGPKNAERTIVLAHGAGAAMDTPFMNAFADGLAERGLRVARFEFPYLSERRRTGKRRPPDREPVLLETWRKVAELLGADGLIIGGKSMGGRMASLVADELSVAGLVCLGYPFHPAGKPGRLRIEHLQSIQTQTLMLQGTRDPFGNREEVADYHLSAQVRVTWLEDGDHGFKPRKRSGRSAEENWQQGISAIVDFAAAL